MKRLEKEIKLVNEMDKEYAAHHVGMWPPSKGRTYSTGR